MGEVIDSPTVNSYVVGVEVVPPTPPPPTDLGAPRPTITSLVPAKGLADQQFPLRITGTGFTEAVEVNVGGRPALETTYVSATQVDVDVDGRGIAVGTRIPVSVRDVSGESKVAEYEFGDGSEIIPPEPPEGGVPTIEMLYPGKRNPANGPFTLSIRGTGYTEAVQVYALGGLLPDEICTWVSATKVDVAVDPAAAGVVGPLDVPIYVVDAGGTSNTVVFQFTESAE